MAQAERVGAGQAKSARVKPLLAEQAVSQKDVDDAVAEDLAAKAALEGAKGDLVKAKFDLDNTLITAPISGRIERSRVYEGRLVSAQTDLLTTISSDRSDVCDVSAPETFLLKRFRDRASQRIQGATSMNCGASSPLRTAAPMRMKVSWICSKSASAQTPAPGTSSRFPNPDNVLFPGQFVKVRILGAREHRGHPGPPTRRAQHGPKGSIVFVVGADNKVEIRDVQATSWQGNQWLIEEGLLEGERVIIAGST